MNGMPVKDESFKDMNSITILVCMMVVYICKYTCNTSYCHKLQAEWRPSFDLAWLGWSAILER